MRKFINKVGTSSEVTDEQVKNKIKEIENKNKLIKNENKKIEINEEQIKIDLQTKQNGHEFVKLFNNSYLESSDLSNEVKKKFKSKKHINYSLQQLMKFNPYHYVSTRVRYNDAVEMKVISEKLSDVNSVKKNQASTYQNNFFKNKKINTKIIKTFKMKNF